MHRLFIAIELPAEIRQRLVSLGGGLPGATWVEADQLHLNLRFIGEVDGGVLRDIEEALEDVRLDSFEFALSGVGFFPPRNHPTQLWVGIAKSEELIRLRNKIERTLQDIGLPSAGRKFTPHITLARLKKSPPERVAYFLSSLAGFESPPFLVREFHLYSSVLGSSGATHRIETTYSLSAL